VAHESSSTATFFGGVLSVAGGRGKMEYYGNYCYGADWIELLQNPVQYWSDLV
jgi:hypothetical protein